MTTVPIEYMEPIIDFLYTNDEKYLRDQNYSDNYCYNMIVICDQYFINRLRNIFELIIAERISIKKCVEMLEFANDYNCKIIKNVCLDFVVLNMSRILENRALDGIEGALLQEIHERYQTKQNVEPKITYNHDDTISDVMLESFVADFQIDLSYKQIDEKQNHKQQKERKVRTTSTSITQQERRNYEREAIDATKIESSNEYRCNRKISESSPLSAEAAKISEELTTKAINWTKVVDKKTDIRKKLVLAGIKSNEILLAENKEKEMFVSLSKLSIDSSEPKSDSKSSEFDVLAKYEDLTSTPRPNINLGNFTPLKMGKTSQKQRKNQAATVTVTIQPSTSFDAGQNVSPIAAPVENVWAIKSPAAGVTPEKSNPINIPQSSSPKSFFDDPSITKSLSFRSQKGAKALSFDGDSSYNSSVDKSSSFTKILKEEKREKEYFEKLRTKSLALTQIEETAIMELEKFYNVENVHDEFITVERCVPDVKPSMNFAVWHQ